jgi:hypothetical protein
MNLGGNVAEKPRSVLARPDDETFEAYVTFVNSFYEALTGKPAGEMDEAEIEKIRASWREFWSREEKEEKPAPPQKPQRSRVQKGANTSG